MNTYFNVPLVGSVITFTVVPNGSWATRGIKYRVDAIEGDGKAVYIRPTGAVHGTSDLSWTYKAASWEAVEFTASDDAELHQ
jgi:hypothetical protein